ncbi:MAG: beta strand repeat-containing protein [Pseudobdellovibrionaceae bacterium]
MGNNRWIFNLMIFFLGSAAWAQTPGLLPFQGRLTDEFGNNVNYTVTVNFRMYPPAGSCYIYEETQTVTPNDLGLFSVLLGDSSYKTYPAGPLAFEKVFNNSVSNTLVDSCAGMYTPALNDWRRIQVLVNGTSLPDMQTIASSPYALHSNFLGGKTASEFIQVSGNTTQTNVNTLTSGNDASSLHNHDSIYARIDSGNNFVGPITSSSGLYASGSSGTVGIGTTATLADLHIRKNTPSFRMEMNAGSGGNGTIDFFSGSSQRASIRASETTNQLVFQTGSTTALTLDQNQNANFAGNLMTNGFLSMGRYTNAQQISLRDTYLIPCGFGCLGTVWTNSTDNSMNYWNGTTIMTVPKFSPVSYVAGGLVVSSNSELSVLAPGGANQVLGMNSAGTTAEYKTLTAGSGVTISNAAGSVTINATGTGGTVTNVTSANADISVATGSSTPVLTLNTGTAVNQIVKLDGSARIPAVDGSLLTNVDASRISGRNVASTAPSLGSILRYNASNAWEKFDCTAGQVLKFNAVLGWNCDTDNIGSGTVTNVTSANADISVASGSSAPVLTLNTGTAANQIVKLDGSAQLPAVNGSQLTSLNATNLSSGTLPAARLPALAGDVTSAAGSNSITLNTVPLAKGGTGLTAAGAANQVLGMNSAGTTAEYKTLTAGSGVTISNAAGSVTINATVAGATLSNGQVWVGNGSNQAAARNLLKTDIKSSVAGNWFTASSACAAGTALNFDSVTDTVSCQALSLTSSQVTTALAYSPVNRAGDSMTGNLSTSGQIRSSQNTVAVGATVDFNTGNTQVLSAPGGSTITLNNMQDGGSYTLVITDTTSRTYSFANCASSKWAPAAASTSGQTVFSILRVTIAGTVTCYISWISGF